jgi:hypothetical protein
MSVSDVRVLGDDFMDAEAALARQPAERVRLLCQGDRCDPILRVAASASCAGLSTFVGGIADFHWLLAEGTMFADIEFQREHLYLVEPGAPGGPGAARIVESDLQTAHKWLMPSCESVE